MKWLFVLSALAFCILTQGCAATRVLTRDCHDAGPGLQNCELVQKI